MLTWNEARFKQWVAKVEKPSGKQPAQHTSTPHLLNLLTTNISMPRKHALFSRGFHTETFKALDNCMQKQPCHSPCKTKTTLFLVPQWKHQATVYNILSPNTAIIGSAKHQAIVYNILPPKVSKKRNCQQILKWQQVCNNTCNSNDIMLCFPYNHS